MIGAQNLADLYIQGVMLKSLESELYSRKKETISSFKTCCRKFLSEVGVRDSYSKEELVNFFQALKEKGYSDYTLRLSFYAIKALLKANGIAWPLGSNVPRLEETLPETWPKNKVKKLIFAVKERGDNLHKFILALSTVYGLRRGEVASVKEGDINLEEGEILIRTEKGGEMRKHIIPDEIKSYLDFDIKKMPSKECVNRQFKLMCQLAKIERRKRENLHIIRASLVTELIEAGVPEIIVEKFMRWKTTSKMVRRYHRPKMENVDIEIFSNHPYLEFWK